MEFHLEEELKKLPARPGVKSDQPEKSCASVFSEKPECDAEDRAYDPENCVV